VEVVLATCNPGKVQEVHSILEASGLTVVMLPMWLGEVETGVTYLENARLKALAVLRLVARPVLAEDAGLEVDALHGLPGPRSARFAGPTATSADNNAKLLRLLDGVPLDRRSARYRAVAVLVLPSGREIVGEGTLEGRIASAPAGEGGFGYDPVFVPMGEARTAAELTAEEKNAVSHRALALREVASQL
jgi:XTP/dITP diphosphohydrolase